MTLTELTREIGELELRDNAFKSDLRQWINRGQHAIAEARNWTFLHNRSNVTITSGTTSANMPARFKSLSTERTPITYTAPGAAFPQPVNVRSREELERMTPGAFGYVVNQSAAWSPFYVFLERNGSQWTLNVPPQFPYTTDATYAVSCFLFPADLAAGTDHNELTDCELGQAIIEWVKWKALPKASPEGIASRKEYNDIVARCACTDARQKLLGRSLRF